MKKSFKINLNENRLFKSAIGDKKQRLQPLKAGAVSSFICRKVDDLELKVLDEEPEELHDSRQHISELKHKDFKIKRLGQSMSTSNLAKTHSNGFRDNLMTTKNIGMKSSFRLPLDEDYIINPPLSSSQMQRNKVFSLEKPVVQAKRQEVFSCTKLSPFMQDLYKFEDVYSKQNVKFNSSSKVVKETPRGIKNFLIEQQIQSQTKLQLTRVI